MAEDEVERAVGERERGGLAAGGLDVQPELGRGPRERAQHPRRDIRRYGLLDHAGDHEVEPEVAGARSDLERTTEAPARVAERLAQLGGDLRLTDLVVLDSP